MANQSGAGAGLTVVVIAGAVARGAYEAAALTAVLDGIGADPSSTVFLGTSSGSINAVLWAQGADGRRATADIGRDVETVWRDIRRQDVFDLPVGDWLGSSLAHLTPHTLLDTAPLERTVGKRMNPSALAANVRAGTVAGAGAVATVSMPDGSGGRARLFYQGLGKVPVPSPGGSLDWEPVDLGPEHVLASAAVPALFPAREVTTPASARGWYIDGGVGLNAPVNPGVDLGATRLVVVSSFAADYPPPPSTPGPRPRIPDAAAESLHAVLGNAMIEDLRTLRRTNRMVAQATTPILDSLGRPYRSIPFLVVAPPNGALGKLARRAFARRSKPRFDFYSALDLLMPGTGLGNDELLSYLFFDADYCDAQFAQARADAAAALKAGWQTA